MKVTVLKVWGSIQVQKATLVLNTRPADGVDYIPILQMENQGKGVRNMFKEIFFLIRNTIQKS